MNIAKNDKYLVIDHSIEVFGNDRIFDYEYAARFPGATVYSCLATIARQRGWKIHTADVFLAQMLAPKVAVCLSYEPTQPRTQYARLLRMGVRGGLLLSGEPPFGSPKFYGTIEKIGKHFSHICIYRGAFCRAPQGCQPHTLYWPVPDKKVRSEMRFEDRSLLCLVTSFRQRLPFGISLVARLYLRNGVSGVVSDIVYKAHESVDKSLYCRDLYDERFQVIRDFSSKPGFTVRGDVWNSLLHSRYFRGCSFLVPPIKCSYEDKIPFYSLNKFALAFESCVYPGFVTEKIFDAFRAGTVPVYLGAPDIEEFVPPECFIDYRKFANTDALWDELVSMSEVRWNQYRKAITEFMESPQYHRHLEENVARQWLDWLEDAAGQA